MDEIDVIMEIETDNNPIIDGLDYYMDCNVIINKVRMRCDQVSIVTVDLGGFDISSNDFILELRRGEWISWVYLDEIESLVVEEFKKGA